MFTKKGSDRINSVVDSFKKQMIELEKGIDEVNATKEVNDETVEAIKAEARRVEREMTEKNAVLTRSVDLATKLKGNIANLLEG